MTSAIDWQGQRRQPCPSCARNDRDRTLGVTMKDDGSAVAHCFRCEYVETWRDDRPGIVRAALRQPARSANEPRESLSDHWREFFAGLEAPAGAALAYLNARGCAIPPADGDLRWHPALRHPCGHTGPGLVALVTHAQTRVPMTLHRTWIRADGTKAPEADPQRLLLGGHRKAGGVVRLWPDDSVATGLAIAEGIETSLSVARYFQPVWAAIDAGNMAALPVLAGIESLVVAADHDPAGLKGAQACADRWAAAGASACVIAPKAERSDWNDVRQAA